MSDLERKMLDALLADCHPNCPTCADAARTCARIATEHYQPSYLAPLPEEARVGGPVTLVGGPNSGQTLVVSAALDTLILQAPGGIAIYKRTSPTTFAEANS